jgi:predicted metal-dependent peptidase
MALHDKRIATYDSIADEVYSAVSDDEEENFDDHLPPNPDAPSQQEVQSAVSSARSAAKAAGKYSSVMDTLIGEILEPQVTWAEQLKSRVQEIAGNTDSTWSRINRRKVAAPVNAIVLPSSTGYAAGDIGITIDVSGSISDRELQVFLSEAYGLFSEVQPRSLTLFWVDTEVLRVDRIEDIEDLVNIKGVRGGGTHMPVVFDYVADEMIPLETMVFLTDGYTDFGDEQPYEVIWCITTDNKKASHGTTINIKV